LAYCSICNVRNRIYKTISAHYTNVWWLLLLKTNHMDHMDAEDKSYG